MDFFFFNSYQQSPVGFQLSCLKAGASQLEKTNIQEILPEEFRSLMTNSGCSCAMGTINGIDYLVMHSLSFADAESRQWYITMGITSEAESRETFLGVIRKLFLDYATFLEVLPKWFHATPTNPLSYEIDSDAVNNWLAEPNPEFDGFMLTDNPVLNQFRSMLEKAKDDLSRRLFLLVPESTVAYFYTQNPLYDGELPHYLFNSKEFSQILQKEEDLLKEDTTEQPKTATPIWEQLGITKEQFIRYVATGVIACAGFLAMINRFIRKK